MFCKAATVSATIALLSSLASAQIGAPQAAESGIKPLTIGDQARPIDIAYWIKGEKVAKFEPNKVYVLVFWTTSFPACRVSMPHLTELQENYKDHGVTIIGVSDERPDVVKDFLAKKDDQGNRWNEKATYRVTSDPDKSVYRDYMFAAVQEDRISVAFIIGKDQHIEWIGEPLFQMDDALHAVVNDKWDRAHFKTLWENEQKKRVSEREAIRSKAELEKAANAKDWDKVISILDGQIARDANDFSPRMRKFTTLLVQMDQPTKAYSYGDEIALANWDDWVALNKIAWFVVDAVSIKTRNLEFASRLATRANELTKDANAEVLDTLARVHYEKGDLQNAVRLQKLAVQHNGDQELGENLAKTLKKYEGELAKKNDH